MASRRGRPRKPILGTGPGPALSRRLRLLCDNADLTLAQLSERTGYSNYTLSTAMGGETVPTWAVVSAIVEACGGDSADWKSAWRDAAGHAIPFAAPLVDQPGARDLDQLSAMQEQQVRVRAVGSGRGVPVGVSGGSLRLPTQALINDLRAITPEPRITPQPRRRNYGPPPIPVTARGAVEFNDYVHRLRLWAGNPSVRDLAVSLGMSRGTVQNLLYPKDPTRLPKLESLTKLMVALGVRDTMVLAEWAYIWRRLMYNDSVERRTQTRADAQSRRDANLSKVDFQRPSSADPGEPEHGISSSEVA